MVWSLFVRVFVFRAFWGYLLSEASGLDLSEYFNTLRKVTPNSSRVQYFSDMDINAMQEDIIILKDSTASEGELKSLRKLIS